VRRSRRPSTSAAPSRGGVQRRRRGRPRRLRIHIGKLSEDEGALYIAVERGAIAFADGLQRYGGALGFFGDDSSAPIPTASRRGSRTRSQGLLARDLSTSSSLHGDPLIHDGKAALRQFIEAPWATRTTARPSERIPLGVERSGSA